MPAALRKNLSRLSLFSGSTLAMAFSMLSVIVLLIWWQRLISRNLENQYRFFKSELGNSRDISESLRRHIREQDEKLAGQIFLPETGEVTAGAARLIDERLQNRQKMVLYEQAFFIILLLSGHLFFLYIYFRERLRRKQTEETILLATHELRQPLQSLSLALESVETTAKGQSLKAIRSGLGEISRLGDLVRWLAGAFSDAGKKQRRMRIENPQEYIYGLIRHEFTPAQWKRLSFTAQQGIDTPVSLNLDPELFRFVLRNLAENALKYASGEVQIFQARTGKFLRIGISSRGTPISPGDFKKLGGIFYRSASREVQNTAGFGLGLYLCSRIAARADGSLVMEHDATGLTTATLSLRITENA